EIKIFQNGSSQNRIAKKLQFIFNFNSRVINFDYFNTTLNQLSTFYRNCDSSLPLIVLLNSPIALLSDWTFLVFSKLDSSFRAILQSSLDNSALHIRPILYGCVQHQGIYIPVNTVDFDKLKIPYQKCDQIG